MGRNQPYEADDSAYRNTGSHDQGCYDEKNPLVFFHVDAKTYGSLITQYDDIQFLGEEEDDDQPDYDIGEHIEYVIPTF